VHVAEINGRVVKSLLGQLFIFGTIFQPRALSSDIPATGRGLFTKHTLIEKIWMAELQQEETKFPFQRHAPYNTLKTTSKYELKIEKVSKKAN